MTKQALNKETSQKPHNKAAANFWQKLRVERASDGIRAGDPIFILAPMADVTDPAFRRIIAKYGKPDVLWTEFVSADGLMLGGREHLIRDLLYTEAERPIVAQLFGSNTETMRAAAKLCTELGFDGIDINMGCPDRSIEKQGAGAATIKTSDVAVQVIRAAKAGIQDAIRESVEKNKVKSGTGGIVKNIPLSVKTRIGYYKNEIDTWLPVLLAENLAAITVHCRTRKEMSKVPARWEHIKEVTALRDKISPETLIIGNGDVRDVAHGRELAKKYGAEGVMIGRSIFGNPWLFSELHIKELKGKAYQDEKEIKESSKQRGSGKELLQKFSRRLADGYARFLQNYFGIKNRYWLRSPSAAAISKEDRLRVLVEHSKLFEELLGPGTPAGKNFAVMKKHFKAYVNGWPGSKELRMKLMEAKNAADVAEIIKNNR